jgi:hypothetical protein
LKLKTRVKTNIASKVIMFEECFEFKKTIFLFYGKQKMVTLQQQDLKAPIEAITKAINSHLNLVVSACVMN